MERRSNKFKKSSTRNPARSPDLQILNPETRAESTRPFAELWS